MGKSLLSPSELEARKSFVGASEVPKLFGMGSAWEVFREKRPDVLREPGDDEDEDELEEEGDDEAGEEDLDLERGNMLEDPVARWAAARLKAVEAFKVCAPIVLPSHLGATPDYALRNEAGAFSLLEVKTAIGSSGWGAEGTDEVPPKVLLQVITQLGVARALRDANPSHPILVRRDDGATGEIPLSAFDLEEAIVVRLDGRLRLKLYRVPANDELFQRIAAAVAAFWKKHVAPGLPPAPGASEKAKAWLREVFPAALRKELVEGGADDEAAVARWLELKRLIKPLAAEKKELENQIRNRVGTYGGLNVRGMLGAVTFNNRKPSPSWKNAAAYLAEKLSRLVGGQTTGELLEEARASSLPEFGPRVLHWSSKLNKEGKFETLGEEKFAELLESFKAKAIEIPARAPAAVESEGA